MKKATSFVSKRKLPTLIALSAVFLAAVFALGVVRERKVQASGTPRSIAAVNTAVTENFDTLASTPDNGTVSTGIPTGWAFSESGTNANTTYRISTGSLNTGDTYSYGATANTERAFGQLRSGSLASILGACFQNNTGVTITSLKIDYTGEQWRFGGVHSTIAERMDFQISTDATSLTTGTYIDVDALDFVPPVTTGTAGALNGNANTATLSSTIMGLSIPNGATFFIRWNDVDATGSDDGLAVDDFSITANPSGPVTPTISVNSPSILEGDSGTQMLQFTVSLSPTPTGTVNFTVATADNTAMTSNSDYMQFGPMADSITAGNSSKTYNVVINGDMTVEPNETFFFNVTGVTGASPASVQGTGTITNDDVTITPINQVQGSGNTSPLVGQSVTIDGIVTGRRFNNGFFLQTVPGQEDGNPNTSEGILVFTNAAPTVLLGDRVRVAGTVTEFVPGADPVSPPVTEITSPVVTPISTGNPLPTAVVLTAADTPTTGTIEQLERFEGMRVSIASMTVVAPTAGTVNESAATSGIVGGSNTGVFVGIINGGTLARPFRETGIEAPEPTPAGSGVTIPPVPRFDGNPERIRVDSEGQVFTPLPVAPIFANTGAVVTGLVGVLDYAFRTYTLLPEPGITPGITNNTLNAVPVPTPDPLDLTIASANMQRFYDDINDAGGDVVLTTTAFQNRLNKASLMIRNVLLSPDVVAVQEMEDLKTLQALATKVNTDLGQPGLYSAHLFDSVDVGLIDVGFLVKTSRIQVISVTQEAVGTLVNPDTTTSQLNDRQSLVLKAKVISNNFEFTVINNHLRSLSGINSTDPESNGWASEGHRVREKRRKQAEFLANVVQNRQTADPNERMILVGDFNSFQFNDGYVDVIGTVKGTPTAATDVVLASTDLVNPNLTNLVEMEPPAERYSFMFGGNAQTLDHALVTANFLQYFARINHARMNSDFSEGFSTGMPLGFRNDPNRPERLSDHDPFVAAFKLPAIQLGTLYVADTANNRVQKFDGTTWSLVGTAGPSILLGRFTAPEAVAASADGMKIYVADTGNNRIQWSTDGGATWALFAGSGIGANQVNGPQGLALDQAGNLFVADTNNNRIVRYNGMPGTGVVIAASGTLAAGQVSSPRGLAADLQGNLFVADFNNTRLQKLANAAGTPTATIIATSGIGLAPLGQVSKFEGLAATDNGDLYVADTNNNRILCFPGGVAGPAVQLAGIGSLLGQVRVPQGVTVSNLTMGALVGPAIFVADTGNNRVVGRLLSGGSWVQVAGPIGLGPGSVKLPAGIR